MFDHYSTKMHNSDESQICGSLNDCNFNLLLNIPAIIVNSQLSRKLKLSTHIFCCCFFAMSDQIVWSSPLPLERGPHMVDYLMMNAKKMRLLRKMELAQQPRKIVVDLFNGHSDVESKTEKHLNSTSTGTSTSAIVSRRSWTHLETFRQLHPEFAKLDFANIVRCLVQISGQLGTQHRILDEEVNDKGEITMSGNAAIHNIGCIDKIDIGQDAFAGAFSGGAVYYITPLQELQLKISCRFGGQFRGVSFTLYDWKHDRSLHLCCDPDNKRVNDRWIDDLKHQLAVEVVRGTSPDYKIEPPKFSSSMPPPSVPQKSNYHPNRQHLSQQQRHNQPHPYSR